MTNSKEITDILNNLDDREKAKKKKLAAYGIQPAGFGSIIHELKNKGPGAKFSSKSQDNMASVSSLSTTSTSKLYYKNNTF